MKKKSLLIVIMATASASSFNQSIGQLRERGNANEQFHKAISDRMSMLKYEAPDPDVAKTQQKEVAGGEATGVLKAISDVQGTYKKGVEAVSKVKAGVQGAVSKVKDVVAQGREIGESIGRIPQQGLQALQTQKLPKATIKAKTTSQPVASQPPSAPSAPSAKAPSARVDLDDAQTNLSQEPKRVSILPDLPGMTQTPEQAKVMSSAKGFGSSAMPSQVDSDASHLTQLADFRQPGASLIAQVAGGGRSRAVGAMGDSVAQAGARANPMNVAGGLTRGGAGSANAQLDTLTQGLRARAGQTGSLASTSTNIHANVGGALEEMKSQIGGAIGDIHQHLQQVAGQVSEVGKGVGAVGEDIASVGTKVASGVSAGLETAGVVADALGPIGDLLGVGMAVFGGIKAKEEAHRAQSASQQAMASVGQGIRSSATQATSVSLDTSKPAQAMAQSHY